MRHRDSGVPCCHGLSGISKALQLRIGINLGDIIIEADGDIYGDGVNVAARLEQMAEPGGIWVSGKVYEEVRDKLPVLLRGPGGAAGQEHRQAGEGL